MKRMRAYGMMVGTAVTLLVSSSVQADVVKVINVKITQNAALTNQFINGTSWNTNVAPASYSGTVWNDLTAVGGSWTVGNLAYSDSALGSSTKGFIVTGIQNAQGGLDTPLLLARGDGYSWSSMTLTITGLPAVPEYVGQRFDLYIAGAALVYQGGVFTYGNKTNTTDHSQATTWSNGVNYVVFTGVQPDVNGQVVVNIDPHSVLSVLNGFQLVEVQANEPYSYVPASDGGGVAYDLWMATTETRAVDYTQFLNAAEISNQVFVSSGEVFAAATTNLYCLTTVGNTDAAITYDPGAAVGERFDAVSNRTIHPMVYVSWFGAAAYCNWQSTLQGRAPVYDPANDWSATLTNSGYRLPTEPEWFKAAAWNRHQSSFMLYGNGSNTLTSAQANYLNSGDSGETNSVRTTPAGYYYLAQASPYGLFDTSGNVWEWCHNLFATNAVNPAVDAHALRGGSWGNLREQVKTTSRIDNPPDAVRNTVGFRILTTTNPNP